MWWAQYGIDLDIEEALNHIKSMKSPTSLKLIWPSSIAVVPIWKAVLRKKQWILLTTGFPMSFNHRTLNLGSHCRQFMNLELQFDISHLTHLNISHCSVEALPWLLKSIHQLRDISLRFDHPGVTLDRWPEYYYAKLLEHAAQNSCLRRFEVHVHHYVMAGTTARLDLSPLAIKKESLVTLARSCKRLNKFAIEAKCNQFEAFSDLTDDGVRLFASNTPNKRYFSLLMEVRSLTAMSLVQFSDYWPEPEEFTTDVFFDFAKLGTTRPPLLFRHLRNHPYTWTTSRIRAAIYEDISRVQEIWADTHGWDPWSPRKWEDSWGASFKHHLPDMERVNVKWQRLGVPVHFILPFKPQDIVDILAADFPDIPRY